MQWLGVWCWQVGESSGALVRLLTPRPFTILAPLPFALLLLMMQMRGMVVWDHRAMRCRPHVLLPLTWGMV